MAMIDITTAIDPRAEKALRSLDRVARELAIADQRALVHMVESAMADIRGIRAPVQASEARGDWVLVPPHPTVEMMTEGQNADDMQHTTQTIAEIYKAMIAAHTQAGPVG